MRRIQFMELHDQPWFPSFLRDFVTDDLQLILHLTYDYRVIVPRLRSALERTNSRRVLDLCSGAGGPWPWLAGSLSGDGSERKVCLTDKYPNHDAQALARAAGQGTLDYDLRSVDARNVPAGMQGFRTLFTAFHHFPPEQARRILRDAATKGEGIGVFELPGRHLPTLLLTFLVPVADVLLVPFLRIRRGERLRALLPRLLWMWLIPVVPLVLWFDGLVSCLRAYSTAELKALTTGLDPSYTWEIGEENRTFWSLPVTYLIGYRRETTTAASSPSQRPSESASLQRRA
jgi:hypothetical protein